MSRKLVVVPVAVILAFAAQARAQSQPVAGLSAGIRQVEEGDLENAVVTLDSVVQSLSAEKGRQKDLALAHLYLGMAHLGLDRTEQAKAAMREAWRNDKDLKLDAKQFSPRVRQLYELAKSEAKAEAERKAQPLTTPTQPPAPPAAATGAASLAPPVPGLSMGARVRLSAPATSERLVVGTVTAFDATSVTIRSEDRRSTFNVPVSSASRFEISRGRSSKGRRALRLGLLGAGLAGGAGAAYGSGKEYDSFCVQDSQAFGFPKEFCEIGKKGVGKWAGIGAASGALIGATIGAVTTREAWRPAERVQVGVYLGARGAWLAVRF